MESITWIPDPYTPWSKINQADWCPWYPNAETLAEIFLDHQ